MELEVEYLYDQVEKGYELRKGHNGDAGWDVPVYKDIIIHPGKNTIPLGFKLVPPLFTMGIVSLRSSWMNKGIDCQFVPFDADFSAEWNLCVYNNTDEDVIIPEGDRICQVVIMPVIPTILVAKGKMTRPIRGAKGLGSTGK